jgi:hypothetical protein
MSSANLDLVRSIYTSWERGDHRYWAGPEMEYVTIGGTDPGGGQRVYGIAPSFREWLSAWSDWRGTADAYVELDRERILVPCQSSVRRAAGGSTRPWLKTHGATLFHVREHLVTRIVQYIDRDRAFADLGISPKGDGE